MKTLIALTTVAAAGGIAYYLFNSYTNRNLNSNRKGDFHHEKSKENIILNEGNSIHQKQLNIKINEFLQEIKDDYFNEYGFNYLGARFDIDKFIQDNIYKTKTKQRSTIAEIVGSEHITYAENYLNQIIHEKYGVHISNDNLMFFITDITRVEGKMDALESIKSSISVEDFNKQLNILNKEINDHLKRYSSKK